MKRLPGQDWECESARDRDPKPRGMVGAAVNLLLRNLPARPLQAAGMPEPVFRIA